MILTATSCKAALRCLRLFRYRYRDGYEPLAKSEELAFGTLWHHALEQWWLRLARPAPERLAAGMDVLAVEAGDAGSLARAAWLLQAYHARWAGEAYTVLGVEQKFRATVDGVDMAGRLDVLVLDTRGRRVLIVEHKTTSEDLGPGTDYWTRLLLDWQASLYLEGARSQGFEPAAVLYDVVRKPKLRPLLATPEAARKYTKATKAKPARLYAGQRDTDESAEEYSERVRAELAAHPEAYLARGEVVRLDAEAKAAREDLVGLAGIIGSCCASGRWPRNAGACWAFGRWCDYHSVCCGEEQLDSSRFRRVEEMHEELVA